VRPDVNVPLLRVRPRRLASSSALLRALLPRFPRYMTQSCPRPRPGLVPTVARRQLLLRGAVPKTRQARPPPCAQHHCVITISRYVYWPG
jgi:hypothetical protein